MQILHGTYLYQNVIHLLPKIQLYWALCIFSGSPVGEISLQGCEHSQCQSIKKWVLTQEKGLGNWAFVPRSLLLVLLSWVYRSLASLIIGEVTSGSLTWNRN